MNFFAIFKVKLEIKIYKISFQYNFSTSFQPSKAFDELTKLRAKTTA